MRIFFLGILISVALNLFAQPDSIYTQDYLNKSTKFAWLTYGGDLNLLSGGKTQQIIDGTLRDTNFGSTIFPRLTIGGIHFWGHADFYVSFPLPFLSYQNVPKGLENLEVFQGIETGFRVYPIALKPQSIRPFAGLSFRRLRFSQESEESGYENGVPNYGRMIHPIQLGLTFTNEKWHFSASGYFNHQNNFSYFVSPTERADITLDPYSFNLSILRYIDSDRNMRNPNTAKRINEYYRLLKQKGLLSSWYFSIGPSSALQISKSPYLAENHPFFYDSYAAAILPDLSVGRYFSEPDFNIGISYRTYGDGFEGFDEEITIRRHSVGIESVKFLFNYLGFVPFAGAALTYENLRTDVNGIDYRKNKLGLGLVFGWDIRVTKTGTGLLRTNLRYFPNLHMDIEGEKMMFDHLEFNFIQWVQFIGRKKALRNSF